MLSTYKEPVAGWTDNLCKYVLTVRGCASLAFVAVNLWMLFMDISFDYVVHGASSFSVGKIEWNFIFFFFGLKFTDGPSGICTSVARGFVHVIYGNANIKANLVPADFCVSAMIASAWDISKRWFSTQSSW